MEGTKEIWWSPVYSKFTVNLGSRTYTHKDSRVVQRPVLPSLSACITWKVIMAFYAFVPMLILFLEYGPFLL